MLVRRSDTCLIWKSAKHHSRRRGISVRLGSGRVDGQGRLETGGSCRVNPTLTQLIKVNPRVWWCPVVRKVQVEAPQGDER